jgi:DivIVA domain-containing protein
VKTRGFGTTRLRPGYDIDEVDAFLSAIRNTFLGIREPSLTPEEIRVKQFTTTCLRPGYEQLEVDAVLDEAESRLAAQVGARRRGHAAEPVSVAAAPAAEAVQIRCLECGAESTDATQVCARCGAPAVGPRSVAAGLAVARPSDGLVAAAAGDARWPPAWIRRGQPYYMICLIFFLALYMIGWYLFERTQGSGLHHPMEWGIDLGVVGALLSVVLIEAACGQFRARQLVWGLVPLLSWTFLAFVPFLWLALIRRRTREWAVFAVYLAAETTMLVISFVVAAAAGYELVAGLLLIAPVHAVLAFSPAAGASSWRETRAANAASLSPAAGRQPVPVTFGLRPGWCCVNVAGGTENWIPGTVEHLAEQMVSTGLVTASDIESVLAMTADRSCHYVPSPMVTAWGQRPG